MPRFVLLHHECPPGYIKPSHWDLMLEFDGVLRTWELRKLPAAWSGNKDKTESEVLTAARLADHRIEFLKLEGPISGNRGSVRRVMSGEFELLANTPDRVRVRLESVAYRGELQLTVTSQRGHWEMALLP
jgi:hypothetical protein